MKEAPQAAKAITLRPSPELRSRIEEFAADRIWSLGTAVEQLVIEALDARSHMGARPVDEVTWKYDVNHNPKDAA